MKTKQMKFATIITADTKEKIDEMAFKSGLKKSALVNKAIEYYYSEVYIKDNIFK